MLTSAIVLMKPHPFYCQSYALTYYSTAALDPPTSHTLICPYRSITSHPITVYHVGQAWASCMHFSHQGWQRVRYQKVLSVSEVTEVCGGTLSSHWWEDSTAHALYSSAHHIHLSDAVEQSSTGKHSPLQQILVHKEWHYLHSHCIGMPYKLGNNNYIITNVWHELTTGPGLSRMAKCVRWLHSHTVTVVLERLSLR